MDYKNAFRTLLFKYGFLSLKHWNSFEIRHGIKNIFKTNQERIRQQVNGKNGLYIFKRGKKIIYIGKAKPLFGRLKLHNRASFEPVPGDTKYNTWHKFWSQEKNKGKITLYWKEVKLENDRAILEKMLAYILNPEFDIFRKKFENKK